VVTDAATRDSLAIADEIVALADREGATDAEALVLRGDEALTRFANSQIHQNVAETNTIVNLRFVDGKRVGVACEYRLDAD